MLLLIPVLSALSFVDALLWLLTEITTPFEIIHGLRAVRYKIKTEASKAVTYLLSIPFVGFKSLILFTAIGSKISWNKQQIIRIVVLLLITPIIIHYLMRAFFYMSLYHSICDNYASYVNKCLEEFQEPTCVTRNVSCCIKRLCHYFYNKYKQNEFDSSTCSRFPANEVRGKRHSQAPGSHFFVFDNGVSVWRPGKRTKKKKISLYYLGNKYIYNFYQKYLSF